MAISYNGLWKLLIDKGMTKVQLRDAVGMGPGTLAKMGKGQRVSLEVLEKICEEVGRNFGFSADEIRLSKSRRADISLARHIAIYIVRNLTNLSMVEIGKEFGNRHYTTVVYTIQNITEQMKTNNDIKETIEDIIKNIRDR